jgi:hypothetical protein
MMNHSARRIGAEDLHVNHEARPGWVTGSERVPLAGEEVYCVAGICTVVKVLGRTGDGSRLLELRLQTEGAKPFFAAASNVLLPREPVAV